ncbi:MAG: VWA domain-containing protein [Verrucomicrobiales bacterium]|nr:VWA domain-containing protein [Verrucomicrobiales bacterium]
MNLTFAQPQFFWLLALLPALVVLKLHGDARGRHLLARAVSARLMPALVTRGKAWRGWTALGCELAAAALFIAALARPQLGSVEEEVTTSGRSLIFAVDTSRSMLATDMTPDRLTRTKLTIFDLIRKLQGDRIGLIAFAGRAFLQAPITQDHDALLETLDQFDSEIIPRGGSNLAEAIDLAVETFTGKRRDGSATGETVSTTASATTSQALLVFSDGEELEGEAVAAARRAAEANITIIAVGVGTTAGGIIPNPENGGKDYVRDEDNRIVKTTLQQKVLEEVAQATRGLYVPLTEVLDDQQLGLVLSKLESSANKTRTLKKAVERYQWPLLAGMLFLLCSVGVRVVRRDATATARKAPEFN